MKEMLNPMCKHIDYKFEMTCRHIEWYGNGGTVY